MCGIARCVCCCCSCAWNILLLIICVAIVGAVIIGVSVFYGVFYDTENGEDGAKAMGLRGFLDSLNNDSYHTTERYHHY